MRNNKRDSRPAGKLLLEVGNEEKRLIAEIQPLVGAANPLQVLSWALSTYHHLAKKNSQGAAIRILNPDKTLDYLSLTPRMAD